MDSLSMLLHTYKYLLFHSRVVFSLMGASRGTRSSKFPEQKISIIFEFFLQDCFFFFPRDRDWEGHFKESKIGRGKKRKKERERESKQERQKGRAS